MSLRRQSINPGALVKTNVPPFCLVVVSMSNMCYGSVSGCLSTHMDIHVCLYVCHVCVRVRTHVRLCVHAYMCLCVFTSVFVHLRYVR